MTLLIREYCYEGFEVYEIVNLQLPIVFFPPGIIAIYTDVLG